MVVIVVLHPYKGVQGSSAAVGNGSVHPLAAQTIAYVRRLLAHKCALEVIFSDAELNGDEWTRNSGVASLVSLSVFFCLSDALVI